jgi:phosphopantothenoylcysteine decarboxylase/phosphopantothenate--cysteine ligase
MSDVSSDARGAGPGDAPFRVTLIVSGSIAAYKACALASMLVKDGCEVQVVATEAALRFVGAASFEALTGRKAYTDMWAPRESMTHISLRKWSDLYVFYPATANRVNQFAAGIAEDLVGATFLANGFEKPFWIAPAANVAMMRHPATVEALAKLEGWGCRIIRGGEGRLACGDVGEGRLAEPEAVRAMVRAEARARIRRARESREGRAPRALVTGGAMTEPVDAVRAIVNTSTGRTSAAVVSALLDRGWEVDYLRHESASELGCEGGAVTTYRRYGEFASALESALGGREYDLVVHAAAVSDYRVADPSGTKFETGERRSIALEANPKLLPKVKSMAKGRPYVIGFKLTVDADEAEGARRAASYFSGGAVDLVIWNDLRGVQGERHDFVAMSPPADPDGLPMPGARGSALSELAREVALAAERALTGKGGRP